MPPHPRYDQMPHLPRLLASFQYLFGEQNCLQKIATVIRALEGNQPIADLMQSPHGSFSTIFLPFHSGTDEFETAMERGMIHPKLIQFCTLCGKIESLTDTMGITGEEPSADDKAKLLPLLKEFLATLPSSEEFKKWLE
ncbi:MAG: hypothetical protein PHS73_03310 [Candidatus Peribacteraceae bacterium]|nr:hypothetical protein [Candidatus Peribacteraceae bacterium]